MFAKGILQAVGARGRARAILSLGEAVDEAVDEGPADSIGGQEMQVESRVSREPPRDLDRYRQESTVGEEVDVERSGRLPVRELQERAELRPSIPGHGGPSPRSRSAPGAADGHPLVRSERDRPLRVVHVQPDQVRHSLEEVHLSAGSRRLRHRSPPHSVREPDPLNGRLAQPHLLGEASAAPTTAPGRRLVAGHAQDRLYRGFRDLAGAPRSRGISHQASDPHR